MEQNLNIMGALKPNMAPKKPMDLLNIAYRALLALVIMVAVIIAAEFGYLFYLNKQNYRLDLEIRELNSKVDFSELKKLASLNEALGSLNFLFSGRVYSSSIFNWVEKLTVPSVRLSNFSFDMTKLALRFDVAAPSFNALALQIAAFRGNENTDSVDMASASLSEKGVSSSLTINLKKELFKK